MLIRNPMLTRNEITSILQNHQPYLRSEFNVRRVGLFGSFSRDAYDETSDVDLVVEFERPIGFRFMELADYLEEILGKEVDILTPTAIREIRVADVADEIEASIIYV